MENSHTTTLELLAPAGSPEKARYALAYGADAIYCGLPDFSMRRRINGFDEITLAKTVEYAHARGKKVYVTVNIYAHNIHLSAIEGHLAQLSSIGIDGVIVSDPGVMTLVKKHLPHVDIHISTQANATNCEAVHFWSIQGARRVILAREVTLEEIREINRKVSGVELEYFVHGAMCMSYSGRCILSKWMTGRSANLGDCAQPCRWAYHTKQSDDDLLEDGQPKQLSLTVKDMKEGIEINLEEDHHGTYFFNSKDLNLLMHLQSLVEAGITSFKIEGRNKSVYYLALVTRAYRKVLDAIANRVSPEGIGQLVAEEQQELSHLMHRGYTTGFLLGTEPEHNFDASHESSPYQFIGQVEAVEESILRIKAHNAFTKHDQLEIVDPGGNRSMIIYELLNDKGEEVESAHGGHDRAYYLRVNHHDVQPFSLIRKIVNHPESQYNGDTPLT